jgi:hypothetical protein
LTRSFTKESWKVASLETLLLRDNSRWCIRQDFKMMVRKSDLWRIRIRKSSSTREISWG